MRSVALESTEASSLIPSHGHISSCVAVIKVYSSYLWDVGSKQYLQIIILQYLKN